jgi:hypothetical protein
VRIVRAALLGAALAAWAGQAAGRTIVVDSALDVAATDGVITLREAIIAANTNTPVNDRRPAIPASTRSSSHRRSRERPSRSAAPSWRSRMRSRSSDRGQSISP